MGNKRVDEPVITIRAMVKIGPWTVEEVRYGEWKKCRRCKTPHKETWVCTIDPDVPDAVVKERLGNDRTWCVGSTCGPTLEMVSDHDWAGTTKELQRAVKLAVRATHTIARARAAGYDAAAIASAQAAAEAAGRDYGWSNASLLPIVAEDLALLLKGELHGRKFRRTSSLLTTLERWLDAKDEAAKSGAPPPRAPWAGAGLRRTE